MTQQYGADEYGDGEAPSLNFVLNNQGVFINGLSSMMGSTLAHVIGTYNVRESVHPIYLLAHDNAHNNLGPTWGTVVNTGLGIINVYNPKNLYISFLLSTITSSNSAYITSLGIILRSPTLDGNIDSGTIVVDDISNVDNDGRTYNLPTWIPGPHT